MTTNKPEVVAWGVPNSRLTERQPFMQLLHTQEGTQYPELLDPLIRLSDYEALQAEVEELRRDAERYRWLRERWGRVTETYDGDSGRITAIGTEPGGEGWEIEPETLDAAIDDELAKVGAA